MTLIESLIEEYMNSITFESKEIDKDILMSIILKKDRNDKIFSSIMTKYYIGNVKIEDTFLSSLIDWVDIRFDVCDLDNGTVFFSRKVPLMLYIAADYEKFDIDSLTKIILEIEKDSFFVGDRLINLFKSCLKSNKNISNELKLWLELNH
jgi:hypothetical protein